MAQRNIRRQLLNNVNRENNNSGQQIFICLLLILFAIGTDQSILNCPNNCTCTTGKTDTTVNCQGKGFTKVPDNISDSTTILNLNNNQIKELGNGSISHLNKLKSLLLNDNKIAEVKSDDLLGLVELQKLQLSRNSLTNFPELGDACSSLTHLVLDQNEIKDQPVPSSFSKCSKMLSLTLSRNEWSTLNSATLSALPSKLKSLKLNSVQLRNITATAFQSVSKVLTSLDLSENPDLPVEQLADVFSETKFLMLTNLILKKMGFTNLTQNFLPLHSTPRLNILHLEGCDALETIAATALDGSPNLQQLFLTDCSSLTQWEESVLDKLKLKKLLLSNTAITTIGGVDGEKNSLKVLSSVTLSKDGLEIMKTNLQCDCNLMWLTQLLHNSSASASCVKDLAKVQVQNGSKHIALMQCHPKNCIITTTTSITSTTSTGTPKPENSGLSTGAIVAIIVVSTVTVLAIILAIVCIFLRRQREEQNHESCLRMMMMRIQSQRLNNDAFDDGSQYIEENN